MLVNGVKVIVQPSGNEIVQVLTLFKGGVQNYPADKAGIEDLAITALTECGTKKDSKNSFKDKLDKVSAEIEGTAGMDSIVSRATLIRFGRYIAMLSRFRCLTVQNSIGLK